MLFLYRQARIINGMYCERKARISFRSERSTPGLKATRDRATWLQGEPSSISSIFPFGASFRE